VNIAIFKNFKEAVHSYKETDLSEVNLIIIIIVEIETKTKI